MAALNFPTNPSVGDTYTASGKTWTWDGMEWASTNYIDLANATGILPVANGGTGTSTPFTLGSVLFAGTDGVYAQDNAKFFWDNSNDYLGLGTAAPISQLHLHAGSAVGVVSRITNSATGATAGDGFERSIDAGGGAYLWNYENQFLKFATNNTQRMEIAANGNVSVTGNARFGSTDAPTSPVDITGPISSPVTVITGDTTLNATHSCVVSNRGATNTLTLPAANTCPGREYDISTIQAFAVVSASANVIPKTGGAAGTAILPATDGAWATIKSDSSSWRIIRSGT